MMKKISDSAKAAHHLATGRNIDCVAFGSPYLAVIDEKSA